jgi:hypothetical protein
MEAVGLNYHDLPGSGLVSPFDDELQYFPKFVMFLCHPMISIR